MEKRRMVLKGTNSIAITFAILVAVVSLEAGAAGTPSLPDGYESLRCLPAYDGDDCLPTGYVKALASKTDVDLELWNLELLIDEMDDRAAEAKLRDFMGRYPKRYEPYWMMAKNFYFRAEQLPADDIAGREATLEKGIEWAERCTEARPLDANCNVFYGALLARLSTTRGIVRSVFNGPKVHTAWSKVVESRQHYRYPSTNTALGGASYGLGIFYRLAPDAWWMSTFFGFRGDIDRSIQMHLLARSTKDDQVELYTELAASYYCKWKRTDSNNAKKRGDDMVRTCLKSQAMDAINEVSQAHCRRLRAEPERGCAYSRDRDQETDPTAFRKAMGD